VPFSEYRQDPAQYFKRTRESHRPLLVTENGRATTVVMDVSDFEDTWRVWESLRDHVQMHADVEAGIRELDSGKGVAHDLVFAELLKEFTA